MQEALPIPVTGMDVCGGASLGTLEAVPLQGKGRGSPLFSPLTSSPRRCSHGTEKGSGTLFSLGGPALWPFTLNAPPVLALSGSESCVAAPPRSHTAPQFFSCGLGRNHQGLSSFLGEQKRTKHSVGKQQEGLGLERRGDFQTDSLWQMAKRGCR